MKVSQSFQFVLSFSDLAKEFTDAFHSCRLPMP